MPDPDTSGASVAVCGGAFTVYRDVDCYRAECRKCRVDYDIGWAPDRYRGKVHGPNGPVDPTASGTSRQDGSR